MFKFFQPHHLSVPVILFAFLSNTAFAAEERFANQQAHICRLQSEQAITLDGILNEAMWQQPSLGELHQVSPTEFASPSQRTDFWICYDDSNLYIAAQMYANPDDVVARQHIQGKSFEGDDQLHISLDPFNQGRNGYFFQANPNGIRREALITNTTFNDDWTTIWYTQSKINAQGWATEIQIPFKSLAFDPRQPDWGFNVGRVIRKTGEILAWSSYGNDVWEMGPSAMGDIQSISEANQGLGLEIQLSATAIQHDDKILQSSDSDTEPSLNVFYRPSPAFTVAATVNTDFSATEVDDQIINLTRFNVLLPEKRDFFLQDATQFLFAELQGNGQPFFSRRIGLDDEGEVINLIGGVKSTGQMDDFSFGALAVRQEASGLQTSDADLVVIRATQNIFKESKLGLIYTNGNPSGIEDNEVFGFDFLYNNSNAIFDSQIQGRAWYQQSDSGYASEDDEAYGFVLAYPNATYDLRWAFTEIGADFFPAMGFVNRSDIRQHDISAAHTRYFGENWIQSFAPNLSFTSVRNTMNELQSELAKIAPLKFNSRANDTLELAYLEQYENIENPFQLLPTLTIAPGEYQFNRSKLQLNTSIARPFYSELTIESGDFYAGKSTNVAVTLGFRPVDRYLVTLGYDQTSIEYPLQNETVTRLFKFNHEYAINEDWAWLLLAQYDNVSRQGGINSRLRWMPTPGKELFLVLNHGAFRDDDGSFTTLEENYSIKFTYTWRV